MVLYKAVAMRGELGIERRINTYCWKCCAGVLSEDIEGT